MVAPRRSVWRRLWQYMKQMVKILLRVTELPRRCFAWFYSNMFKPIWDLASTIMTPVYNYFVAIVTTVLPASMNPFHSYIYANKKQDIYTRFSHGGQHLIWSWKAYLYTSNPNTLRKTFHEQLAMDPFYYSLMDEIDKIGIFQEVKERDEFNRHAREQIINHFKSLVTVLPEYVPLRREEMYRQAIGAETRFGWWMQKIFFWWADFLYILENILDYPVEIFVRFMRRFGFQREYAMKVQQQELLEDPSVKMDKKSRETLEAYVSYQHHFKQDHGLPVDKGDGKLLYHQKINQKKPKTFEQQQQKIKSERFRRMASQRGFAPRTWGNERVLVDTNPWKQKTKDLTPRQLTLLGTIDPGQEHLDEEMLASQLAKLQFRGEEENRVRWGLTALKSWLQVWEHSKKIPILLSQSFDAFGKALLTPLAHVFGFVDAALGTPIRSVSTFLINNWLKLLWIPFKEDIFEPIIYKRLWLPVFSQPYEDLVDPLIGRWIKMGIQLFFYAASKLAQDPLIFLFSALNRIMRLPGDLLYLVYLFMLELESSLYFYFLYPMTAAAIKHDSLGRSIWTRLYNIWRTFLHIVGYTKPTAVMGMSVVFTSMLVFFLNLVPF